MHHLGNVQHRLGRDAPDVEAGTPQILLLDNGDFCAELCGADCGDIATRTCTDHCDIILIACHDLLLHVEQTRSTGPLRYSIYAWYITNSLFLEKRERGGDPAPHYPSTVSLLRQPRAKMIPTASISLEGDEKPRAYG